jgi:hypothetical protein
MENVIMVKQWKRVRKNVRNVVETMYVVQWKTVRIVLEIVVPVRGVEMDTVIMGKRVGRVL